MIRVNLYLTYGICQRPCCHCVIPYMREYFEPQYITLSDIEAFIRLNKDHASDFLILIIPMGEPLINKDIFKIIDNLDEAGFNLLHMSTNLALELTDAQLQTLGKIKDIAVDISSYRIPQRISDLVVYNWERLVTIASSSNVHLKKVYHPRDSYVLPERISKSVTLRPEPVEIFSRDMVKYIMPKFDYLRYLKQIDIHSSDPVLVDSREMIFTSTNVTETTCVPSQVVILPTGMVAYCGLMPLGHEELNAGNAFQTPLFELFNTEQSKRAYDIVYNRKLAPCKGCKGCGRESDSSFQNQLYQLVKGEND